MDELMAKQILDEASAIAKQLKEFNLKYEGNANIFSLKSHFSNIHLTESSEHLEDVLHLTRKYVPMQDGEIFTYYKWNGIEFWHGENEDDYMQRMRSKL